MSNKAALGSMKKDLPTCSGPGLRCMEDKVTHFYNNKVIQNLILASQQI